MFCELSASADSGDLFMVYPLRDPHYCEDHHDDHDRNPANIHGFRQGAGMKQHIATGIEESMRDHACEDGLRPPGDEPKEQRGQDDSEEPWSDRFVLKIIHM